jgi:hypothetical protein
MMAKTRDFIEECRRILVATQPATVRGVAYQLFTRQLLPDMGKNSTSLVSRNLVKAREQGTIPWDWIVDETRPTEHGASWSDPGQYMEVVWDSYKRDRWTNQPERVIVLSEKGTVGGLLRPVMRRWGVPFAVMHGFGSATALHDLAKRSASERKPLTILYVGDHDPSGRHMSDVDLPGRLERYGGVARMERIAVTPAQIARYDLPTFPVTDKKKDPNYRWFVREHGMTCCELDALGPVELREMVDAAIRAHVDIAAWELAGSTEAAERASLQEFFETWPGAA